MCNKKLRDGIENYVPVRMSTFKFSVECQYNSLWFASGNNTNISVWGVVDPIDEISLIYLCLWGRTIELWLRLLILMHRHLVGLFRIKDYVTWPCSSVSKFIWIFWLTVLILLVILKSGFINCKMSMLAPVVLTLILLCENCYNIDICINEKVTTSCLCRDQGGNTNVKIWSYWHSEFTLFMGKSYTDL
jgi:hypothetical protein